MAIDMFLIVSGITGPSTVVPGAIEVTSFSFGVSNSATIGSTGGGSGAGRASFQDLVVAKSVDTSSPALFSAAASGRASSTASLYLRKAGIEGASGGSPVVPGAFLVYDFSDVFVRSIAYSGSDGDSQPSEEVHLEVGQARITYYTQQADGSAGQPIQAGWNITQNKSV